MQIQKARQTKNWTQKRLAQACSLQESLIRDYENGSVIPQTQDLLKMGRVMGVTLRNK